MPAPACRRAAAALGLAFILFAGPAIAQERPTVGIGYRFSLVSGASSGEVDLEAARYQGGFVRVRLSDYFALEGAIDYRSLVSPDLSRRIKDLPVQASVLAFLGRGSFAPYAVGGIGWYSQTLETLQNDAVLDALKARTVGYHFGAGAEFRLGRHAAIHGDCRYTFVRFGDPQDGEQAVPIAMPFAPVSGFIPGLDALQNSLKLSHKGAMWTGGVTVYF